jgi:hypothetical protein
MDARQFRQFRQGHSVLVAELPDCLPKNDLLAFVSRDHTTILDYYPWANNSANRAMQNVTREEAVETHRM